jgi:modulator of FtsH protease HflK
MRAGNAQPSFSQRGRELSLAASALLGRIFMSNGKNEGPPDLDELWRDFNRKLGSLFGKGGGGNSQRPNRRAGDGGGPSFEPDMKSAGLGAVLIAAVAGLVWLGSGFYIVQEGHQAVVTTFGKFTRTAEAGWGFRWPWPMQAHDIVAVTQLRSVEVGRNNLSQTTGLRDSSMLTQDENIVDMRFTVQYRLKDARQYLFENRDPDAAVIQASESAIREIVGRSKVDEVLYEQRDAIANEIAKSVQAQLDRLRAGIVVANINVQSVQVPEQVQAAFEDAQKAKADSDRFKNEAQAYANDVIPKAQGTASRLREQAQGYGASIVARASGDSERFKQVLVEYQKAPGVTRERMYLESMQQVYSNVSKVMVDSRSNSNLLYLPLDKLVAGSGNTAGGATVTEPATTTPPPPAATVDSRSRDGARTRDRENR